MTASTMSPWASSGRAGRPSIRPRARPIRTRAQAVGNPGRPYKEGGSPTAGLSTRSRSTWRSTPTRYSIRVTTPMKVTTVAAIRQADAVDAIRVPGTRVQIQLRPRQGSVRRWAPFPAGFNWMLSRRQCPSTNDQHPGSDTNRRYANYPGKKLACGKAPIYSVSLTLIQPPRSLNPFRTRR